MRNRGVHPRGQKPQNQDLPVFPGRGVQGSFAGLVGHIHMPSFLLQQHAQNARPVAFQRLVNRQMNGRPPPLVLGRQNCVLYAVSFCRANQPHNASRQVPLHRRVQRSVSPVVGERLIRAERQQVFNVFLVLQPGGQMQGGFVSPQARVHSGQFAVFHQQKNHAGGGQVIPKIFGDAGAVGALRRQLPAAGRQQVQPLVASLPPPLAAFHLAPVGLESPLELIEEINLPAGVVLDVKFRPVPEGLADFPGVGTASARLQRIRIGEIFDADAKNVAYGQEIGHIHAFGLVELDMLDLAGFHHAGGSIGNLAAFDRFQRGGAHFVGVQFFHPHIKPVGIRHAHAHLAIRRNRRGRRDQRESGQNDRESVLHDGKRPPKAHER